jgi:hypothetical protein
MSDISKLQLGNQQNTGRDAARPTPHSHAARGNENNENNENNDKTESNDNST